MIFKTKADFAAGFWQLLCTLLTHLRSSSHPYQRCCSQCLFPLVQLCVCTARQHGQIQDGSELNVPQFVFGGDVCRSLYDRDFLSGLEWMFAEVFYDCDFLSSLNLKQRHAAASVLCVYVSFSGVTLRRRSTIPRGYALQCI